MTIGAVERVRLSERKCAARGRVLRTSRTRRGGATTPCLSCRCRLHRRTRSCRAALLVASAPLLRAARVPAGSYKRGAIRERPLAIRPTLPVAAGARDWPGAARCIGLLEGVTSASRPRAIRPRDTARQARDTAIQTSGKIRYSLHSAVGDAQTRPARTNARGATALYASGMARCPTLEVPASARLHGGKVGPSAITNM